MEVKFLVSFIFSNMDAIHFKLNQMHKSHTDFPSLRQLFNHLTVVVLHDVLLLLGHRIHILHI